MLFALTDFFFDPVEALLLQGEGLFKLAEQRIGGSGSVAAPFEPRDELLLRRDTPSSLRDVLLGQFEMALCEGSVRRRKHIP